MCRGRVGVGGEQRSGLDPLIADKGDPSSCVEVTCRGRLLFPSHCFSPVGPEGLAAPEAVKELWILLGSKPCPVPLLAVGP